MQPYFFPYLGYFGLIAHTDHWIVFDPVQYIRKGWVNRNRVLKHGGGWKYVGVTMAPHGRETLIRDMQVASGINCFNHLVRHLDHYRIERAPHYGTVIDLLEQCFTPPPVHLVHLLNRSLDLTCRYLGIEFNAEVYSRMDLAHDPATRPGEWALNICRALGTRTYINPSGGREIFEPGRFKEHGIELLYHHQELPPYPQETANFEQGLSIIDVMMFNEPAAIRQMLDMYRLEAAW